MDVKLVRDRIRNSSNARVSVPETPIVTSFHQQVLCLGSCFARTIRRNLDECGFVAHYDASSSCHFSTKTALERLSRTAGVASAFSESDIAEAPGAGFVSLKHFNLAAENRETLRIRMEASDQEFASRIHEADVVIYTIGTSSFLKSADTGTLIHGAPGFDLDYEVVAEGFHEVVADLRSLCALLLQLCKPSCRFVVTLSPQRYGWEYVASHGDGIEATDQWRDGLVAHTYDKSKLRVALQEVLKELDPSTFFYFPSYEIVLEELRGRESFDYDHLDFLHIGEESKNYVANRFINRFTSAGVRDFLHRYNRLRTLFKPSTRLSPDSFTTLFDDFAQLVAVCDPDLGCRAFVRRELEGMSASMNAVVAEGYVRSALPRVLEGLPLEIKSPPTAVPAEDEGVQRQLALLARVDGLVDGSRVAVWGTGEVAVFLLRGSNLLSKQKLTFFDRNCGAMQRYFGVPVFDPAELKPENFDWFVVGSLHFAQEICAALTAKGIGAERIVKA